jgi:hypothetical protein
MKTVTGGWLLTEVFPEMNVCWGVADDKQMKLAQKLTRVMGRIDEIAKKGRNDHFGYNYARDAEVMETVRKELVAEKIAVLVSVPWQERVADMTKVALDVTFIDSEGGGTATVRWFGEGQDKGDKGLYKAYTGGIKYAMLKGFLIPTDDDPEKPDKPAARSNKGGKAPAPEATTTAPPEDFNNYGTESSMTEDDQSILDDDMIAATVIPFGKYKGKTLKDVAPTDSAYLEWVSKKSDNAILRNACTEYLKRGLAIFK